MRLVLKIVKWMFIVMVVCSIIGIIFGSNDKYSKLESYIENGELSEAKALIDELEKSSADNPRFVNLKSSYFESQELFGEAAEVILAYYSSLKDKGDFGEGFTEKLKDLKEKTPDGEVANRIDEVLAEIAAAEEAKQAKEQEKANKEKAKEVDKLLETAISDESREELIKLYQADLNPEQKEKLITELDLIYKEWIGLKYRKISEGSLKTMEEVAKELAFLNGTSESDFTDLKKMQVQIELLISLQKEENQLKSSFGDSVQYVDTNTIEYLDVYVASRVKSATHINIAGIDITSKYTDQYQVTSYEVSSGVTVPTADWYGIVIFRNIVPTSSGVIQTMVSYVDSQQFVDSQGFSKEMPVYMEVSQADIDYSDQKDYLDAGKKPLFEALQALL